jgi:hypothetical protein
LTNSPEQNRVIKEAKEQTALAGSSYKPRDFFLRKKESRYTLEGKSNYE